MDTMTKARSKFSYFSQFLPLCAWLCLNTCCNKFQEKKKSKQEPKSRLQEEEEQKQKQR